MLLCLLLEKEMGDQSSKHSILTMFFHGFMQLHSWFPESWFVAGSWVMPVFINASEDCDTLSSWHRHLQVSPGRSLMKSN